MWEPGPPTALTLRPLPEPTGPVAGARGEAERYRLEIVEPPDPVRILEPSSLSLVGHSSPLEGE